MVSRFSRAISPFHIYFTRDAQETSARYVSLSRVTELSDDTIALGATPREEQRGERNFSHHWPRSELRYSTIWRIEVEERQG